MRLLTCFLITLGFTDHAQAERRALIIGNAAYTTLERLDACGVDATSMVEAFRAIGVSIHDNRPHTDLSGNQMDALVQRFAATLGPKDEAFFYFSGHGMETDGKNYLLPVEFNPTVKSDALALYDVLDLLERTPASLRIVILDACRNPGNVAPKGTGLRPVGLGEVQVEAKETLVCYSTKHGTVSLAPYSEGKPSIYTGILAREILQPGTITQVLQKVALEVMKATKNRQMPFTYGNLVNDHRFVPLGFPEKVPAPELGMPEPTFSEYRLDLVDYQPVSLPKQWIGDSGVVVTRWANTNVIKSNTPKPQNAELRGFSLAQDFYIQWDMITPGSATFGMTLIDEHNQEMPVKSSGRQGYPWNLQMADGSSLLLRFEKPEPFVKTYRLERRGGEFQLSMNCSPDRAVWRSTGNTVYKALRFVFEKDEVCLLGLEMGPLTPKNQDSGDKPMPDFATRVESLKIKECIHISDGQLLGKSVKRFRYKDVRLGSHFAINLGLKISDGFDLVEIKLLGRNGARNMQLNLQGRRGYNVLGSWPIGGSGSQSLKAFSGKGLRLVMIRLERRGDEWGWSMGNQSEPIHGIGEGFEAFDEIEVELRFGKNTPVVVDSIAVTALE
jgi:hypothetical protein